MSRKNLDGTWWGPSRIVTLRLASRDEEALRTLKTAWGGTTSEVVRRAIREAARAVRLAPQASLRAGEEDM